MQATQALISTSQPIKHWQYLIEHFLSQSSARIFLYVFFENKSVIENRISLSLYLELVWGLGTWEILSEEKKLIYEYLFPHGTNLHAFYCYHGTHCTWFRWA